MIRFEPFSPVDIRFTTLHDFQQQLSLLSDNHVIIFADEGTFARFRTECRGFESLINDKKNRLIRDIRPNPSINDICRHLNALRNDDRYDTIMAIGGGSCIDIAKAISALQYLSGARDVEYDEVAEAIAQKSFFNGYEPADIIAIPTTAGTGSEVTKWATVWDMRNKKKLSVEHNGCFSKAAYIIPELTESMPPKVTLSTGLDAMSHAVESFWAKARNPLSQALALDSISRIKNALPAALKLPHDIEIRKEMCIASLLAGLAFSMTKTTACHSISYPLTMNYGIPHGFASVLTLSPVMEINAAAVPEIWKITELFGGAEGFESWLLDLTHGIQELRLSAFGINADMIDDIVREAYTLGRMDNNPVALQHETVKSILENVL